MSQMGVGSKVLEMSIWLGVSKMLTSHCSIRKRFMRRTMAAFWEGEALQTTTAAQLDAS